MSRLDALREVAAKVEAGDASNDGSMYRAFGDRWTTCFDAFHGSLDAAKALHEAVLPGWTWDVSAYGSAMVWQRDDPRTNGVADDDTTARAWLLAILRALIAQEEAKEDAQ